MAMEVDQEVTENRDEHIFTCERCSHFPICMLRMNIGDFMAQHFPTEKPIEVSELAKICNEYDPIMKLTFEK